VRALVGDSWLLGQKAELGKESARKVETVADSVIISSSRMPFEIFMLGTRPRGLMARYSLERGLVRSMRTSS